MVGVRLFMICIFCAISGAKLRNKLVWFITSSTLPYFEGFVNANTFSAPDKAAIIGVTQ